MLCSRRQGREKKTRSAARSHSVLSSSAQLLMSDCGARPLLLLHHMWENRQCPVNMYLARRGFFSRWGEGLRNANRSGQEVGVVKRKVPEESGMLLPSWPLLIGRGG